MLRSIELSFGLLLLVFSLEYLEQAFLVLRTVVVVVQQQLLLMMILKVLLLGLLR